jgi:hypothetical protein
VPAEISEHACSSLFGRVSENVCGAIRYYHGRRAEAAEREVVAMQNGSAEV